MADVTSAILSYMAPTMETLGEADTVSFLNITTSNYTDLDNTTSPSAPPGGCNHSVHDIERDKLTRLVILYLTIVLGAVGCSLVLLWMACNRRVTPRFNHLSRVNSFILNLAIADLLVILVAVLPQLVWEYVDREWGAGPAMCRIVKFLQSFSMMSSNYILVVIAVDRHQAILAPLRESLAVWKMAGVGWAMAAILSSPVLGLFHLRLDESGKVKCENIFRDKPYFHRQLWMTFVAVVVFFIPLVILIFCYTRIFTKIARKATESNRARTQSFKPGKVHLQSTHSSSLPKAKIKTLKMTFVIIMAFVVCSTPYFIVEMIMSYGDHCIISPKLYGLLGGMAACNSAANPYVFLLFNASLSWIKELKKCGTQNRSPQRGFSGTQSTATHYSMYRNSTNMYQPCFRENPERVEMFGVNSRKQSM